MNVAYLLTIRKGIPKTPELKSSDYKGIYCTSAICGVPKNHFGIFVLFFLRLNCHGFILTDFLKTFIPVFTIWVSVVICTSLTYLEKMTEVYKQSR